MGTVQEKKALARLIHENLVHLCKSNAIYGGQFDLDGIICISGHREGQEIVVKLHERFGSNPNTPTKFPQKHDADTENNNRHFDNLYKAGYNAAHNSIFTASSANISGSSYHPLNDIEPEMLDLRMNNGSSNRDTRQMGDVPRSDISSISKQSESAYSSPAKRWKYDGGIGGPASIDSTKTSNEHSFNAMEFDRSYSTNTSPSVDDQVENLSMSAANSEDGNSLTASPDKAQYLGKSPYLASPYHLQKKTPLKQERWTPNTPLPTIPECRQCGFTFESFEVLSEHNEAVHSVFTCQHCHKTFTSRSNLERHSRLHTGFKPYICAICGKAFSRKDHLSNHSAKHAFKCGNCNKRYADKQSLATHFSYEHESMLTNTCEYCNKGFASLEACEEHVKTHPQYQALQKAFHHKVPDSPVPPSKKYNCDTCKFIAPDRITLLKHRMIHIDGQKCFTCLSCAKVFTDPLQYDEHMLTHEGQMNIFECCLCRQIFPTLDVLQRHEMVHLNEDMGEMMTSGLPCPHCDKVLRNMPALQEHILQHAATLASANKKQHKCLYCNMGFGTYAELCRHMDELRHYPPDPRMLFASLAMPQPFGAAAFDARKFSDLFAQSQKHAASRELMLSGTHGERFATRPMDRKPEAGEIMRQVPTDYTFERKPEKNEEPLKENGLEDQIPEKDRTRDNEKEENENEQSNEQEDTLENDIGSDIEVVEPEAPEENMPTTDAQQDSFNADFEVTEDKPDEIEVADNKENSEESSVIQNQPVKSMLCNKNCNNSVDAETANDEEMSADSKARDMSIPQPVEIESNVNGIDEGAINYSVMTKERARKRKGPSPEKYVDDGEPVDMSMNEYYDNYDMESLASENSNSTHMSFERYTQSPAAYSSHLHGLLNPGMLMQDSKLQMQIRSERKREVSRITPNKMSVDIPPGPCTCSICQVTLANFQTLEQHCFAEHNRCPCMFCPKTFAQKANRDRHVCLHTGDKPYECPECGERFSRGDKLKLHRVRTHNIPTHTTGYGSGIGGPSTGKRDSITPLAPGRDWVIPSPSTNHIEPEGWGMVKDSTGNGLVPSGGEWMVQENMSY